MKNVIKVVSIIVAAAGFAAGIVGILEGIQLYKKSRKLEADYKAGNIDYMTYLKGQAELR